MKGAAAVTAAPGLFSAKARVTGGIVLKLNKMLTQVFGSRNARLLREISKIVDVINRLEPAMQALSDEALAAKTPELRRKIADGTPVDDVLPEAFAVVREASQRTLQMRHFDVQLIGAVVLHRGKIAEMRTGEGKTLAATLPVYLNALAGHSVHVVTVNDYLARRDAEWMGAIYSFLGITVGVVVPNQSPEDKRAAYACDVVYGTNNEFGFDYLRDNMAFKPEQRAQGALTYAIVDEVDSILIDEARTPLIISGAAEQSTQLYHDIDRIIPMLDRQMEEDGPGDFSVDEKARQVFLTDDGYERAESLLVANGLLDEGGSLYDFTNITLLHHVQAGLKAHALFQRDVDYIVNNGQIVIVDEFTGRMMPGRRWSDGLHQAVEAKEGVKIQRENQTLASITFQNYFRLYDRLAGMTGTADTEAEEFQQIYALEVVVIPTDQPMVRDDMPDLVYRTSEEKFRAIVAGIRECVDRKQPVLVGTATIETSEFLSVLLNKAGVAHQVLNAKQHEREAKIVAEAGRPGTVTIATNMAGRGTDIVLGGNLEMEQAEAGDASQEEMDRIKADWQQRHDTVVAAGGLHVLSTERNESRRVDNQLRGRSGRQGDPGSSRFYLSLEDNLLRIFASEKVAGLMEKLGMEEDEAIEHNWVSKAIENAQKKVEGRNFDIRKQLLEYDDVANEQRKVVYEQRSQLMESSDISEMVETVRKEAIRHVFHSYAPPDSLDEQWEVDGLSKELERMFNLNLPIGEWVADKNLTQDDILGRIETDAVADYESRFENLGQAIRDVEKSVMLMVLDTQWKEHLSNMDHLRQGIHLRGYAQKNPKQEYKREAFEIFTAMLEGVRREFIRVLSRLVITEEHPESELTPKRREQKMQFHKPEMELFGDEQPPAPLPASQAARPQSASQLQQDAPEPYVREGRKVGRNELCPCGSGRKYKQCCAKAA